MIITIRCEQVSFLTICLSDPLISRRWCPRWVKTAPRSSPLCRKYSPFPADILVISALLESWTEDDPRSPPRFVPNPRWILSFTESLKQGVSLVSLLVCGKVRTGAEKSGSSVSLLVGGSLAKRFEKVRTGAKKSSSRVSLLAGGHLADICGEMRASLARYSSWMSLVVGGFLTDRCGKL